MSLKIEKFLTRHGIVPSDIVFIDRSEKKTRLHLIGREAVETYITVKDFLASLPPDRFICIDKGVVVSRDQIKDITGSTYIMSSGDLLEGRKNRLSPHKELLRLIRQNPMQIPTPDPDSIRERFLILESMPLPFAVLAPTCGKTGKNGDFMVLSLNKAARELIGKSEEDAVGQHVTALFPLIDPSALRICADTVQTGESHSYSGYSSKRRYSYTLRAFRPLEGCCAVLLCIDL